MGCPFCKACFALCSRPVAWEHTGMIVSLPLCVLIQLGLDLDFPGFLFFPDQSSLQVDSETDHISPVVFSWTINACTSSQARLHWSLKAHQLNQCSPFYLVSLASEYVCMVFTSPHFSGGKPERFTALGQGHWIVTNQFCYSGTGVISIPSCG